MRLLPMLFAVLLATPASAETLSADDLGRARDAIELHYIQSGIYTPTLCKRQLVESGGWVRCTSAFADAPPGGLFYVNMEDGEPHIWTGNGKAIQHLGSASVLTDLTGTSIPAGRWEGEPLKLKEGLSATGADP